MLLITHGTFTPYSDYLSKWKKKSFNIVNYIDTKQTCLYKDIKTLMPRQNGWQFADNNLKYIFLNENI